MSALELALAAMFVVSVAVVAVIAINVIRFWWGGRRARREYERRVGIRRK